MSWDFLFNILRYVICFLCLAIVVTISPEFNTFVICVLWIVSHLSAEYIGRAKQKRLDIGQ